MRVMKNLAVAAALTLSAAATPALAAAGFVALEGSDSTALHRDIQYTPQLFKYLQGSSTLNVLVFNPSGLQDLTGITGGVGITNVTSLTGVTLANFSAIYIESPSGCCTANNTVLNGFGVAVSAFIAAGGNLSIENYVGGAYDGVVPGGAAPAGTIQGAGVSNGGIGGGPGCTDNEVITALGIAKGFTQPPVDGCWAHQGYSNSYFGSFGYVDLIHADPAYTFADGTNNGSSFLAFGGTLGSVGGVPEPAAWALMITGFSLVGVAMRRRTKLTLA